MNPEALFDKYSLQARVLPALLVLLPFFITLAIWVPQVYELAVGLTSLALASGALLLLAHIARSLGRKTEQHLFKKWGGKPTTLWLSHSDNKLDIHTKARYHGFLTEHVDNWTAPSPEEESKDPCAARIAYDSAVKWLLERTRDQEKFSLVFKENISYGFRRNLLGLKILGLTLTILCSIGNAWAVCTKSLNPEELLRPEGIASFAFSLVMVTVWAFVVRPSWVRDAADGYARALLAACDRIGSGVN